MLKIDNAVKIFSPGTPNEHKALNSLSLHLERGEFVTIVGSNGAGKSTMFNAVCGNFLLDSGKIKCYNIARTKEAGNNRLFRNSENDFLMIFLSLQVYTGEGGT